MAKRNDDPFAVELDSTQDNLLSSEPSRKLYDKTILVNVTSEMHQKLRRISFVKDTPISEIIRNLIDQLDDVELK